MRVVIAVLVALPMLAISASAEPVNCQKQIVKNLLKFKKTYLKKVGKCVDNQNVGKIGGPCPDPATAIKIDTLKSKIRLKIESSCPAPDLTTLGFPTSCAFETTATGIESTCAGIAIGGPGDFADCLLCWKGAELAEFIATLYASHSSELCDGALDETSSVCSELDCATPLPVQRDLGDTGENDCQKAIGKGGIKHLVSVEKTYEKCGLLGNSRATCDADLVVQAAIDKAELKLDTLIHNKCGNRDPVLDPPYCCKTDNPQVCMASASRADCEDNLGGQVINGKTCVAGMCENASMGGNQKITWWSTCPINDTCDGTLDTLDELIACVDASAKEIASELLCIQFASGWGPCPADSSPSPAFLD